MFLGIEIGGTKLQVGAGPGDGSLTALQRSSIVAADGADAIRRAIIEIAGPMAERHRPRRIGIGFGGPVQHGRTIKSHQVGGWENFDLASWIASQLGLPAVVGNDCDAAALAEANHGAGMDSSTLLYVTVGTGIGGGLVVDRRLHASNAPAVAEIGHLRPGLQAERTEQTVESLASGWGIAAEAAARVRGDVAWPLHHLGEGQHDPHELQRQLETRGEVSREYADDLLARCENLDCLTAEHVSEAAADGNQLASDCIEQAIQTLGWAVAQAITLTAADHVVVGGGVSLLGEMRFFRPLREACARYVFPPLQGHYQILPAQLGEEVVVHGSISLAKSSPMEDASGIS